MSGAEQEVKGQLLIRKWLDKWRGGTARLWQYSVSHKLLVLRLTHPQIVGCLDVCCGDTTYVCCNTSWDDADLRLEVRPENEVDLQYSLWDALHDFRIVCGIVEVKEHARAT
jgi:hypothetical protein